MIIDGKKIASDLRKKIAQEVSSVTLVYGRAPTLAVIMIGHDPASEIYVRHKHQACLEVGVTMQQYALPTMTSQGDLLCLIQQLNHDKNTDGILVQLPLPFHIMVNDVLKSISPQKDVDGFHPYNIGCLAQRRSALRPCTPQGVMHLLAHVACDFKNSDAVVVGYSSVVGQPMALELLSAGSTVTICHSNTRDISKYIQTADIIVSAVGKPALIKGEWIKEGAIVIDVGITRLPAGVLMGDVEFESAVKRARWITPVPGGVGPMTIAMLLQNTLLAMKNNIEKII